MTSTTRANDAPSAELDKMLRGELYNAFDPTLLRMRNEAKQLCFELNLTSPMDVEKRKEITKKLVGVDDAHIESPFQCDYGCHLKLGKKFYANHGCTILDCGLITIGDNCQLAPHVVISSATHPPDPQRRLNGEEYTRPIVIKNNVWIGANATINPGVSIGNNAIVGAGAVVTRDVADNVVVAGVPAKVIRTLTEES